RDREAETVDVPVEQERQPAVGAHGLERNAAAQERLVVCPEDGLARVDEPAPRDRDRVQRHTAARSGRAFTHDSSISASGSESQTMPPPTQRWIVPSATANVRMVRAKSKSPFACTVPSAPIEAPRPTGSRRAISSTAAIFGAPV